MLEPTDSPGGQPEQVVHGVGMIPQTILLLQQLEGGHAQSLEEEEAPASSSGAATGVHIDR